MAASSIKSGGLATFIVKVAGSPVPDGLRIFSVEIDKKVNRISKAKIVILDGEANTGKFEASSSNIFLPGADVSIEGGYDSKTELIFKGIITQQSIRIDELIGSALEVECRDASIRMIVGRKSLTYAKQKDSQIIASIIATYPSLRSDVTATTVVWPEQVQYYVTDWDFILARAEANGLIVTTLNGKVSVVAPGANSTPVLSVGFGNGLMEFNADLNSITQLGTVKATTWDYKKQVTLSQEAQNTVAGPGNLSSKELSKVVGLTDYQLQTPANLESEDLTTWSKAQMIKSEYSKICGDAKFQGTNLVDPAKYITLTGLGDRFTGDYFISGVTHSFSDGNWLTTITVGLAFSWFTEEPDVMAPPTAGLLPGARGLFTGTVKKMYEDPDSQFRILVNVPLFDPNGEGIWARLANFYSTNGAGAFFMPEVGDEVVLGFLNEDPRYPIILGSLYSSTKIVPYKGLEPNQKNSKKAIVSKSGIYIEFDDEEKIFTISTPGKNKVIISDKDKKITIEDQNKNSIVMSSDGITIKSQKDINMEAGGNINLKATQGIKIAASGGDVNVSGVNIKEKAQAEYSAEGSATAKVSAGMQLTMKAAMIMIN